MSSARAGIFHGVLQVFELVVQVADAAAAGDGLVEHRAARHLLDVLAEVADGQLLRNRDLAFVGRFLADDHAEERGLAGAVGADQADLLAGVQLERGVDEEELLAVLLVDVGKGDHQDLTAYLKPRAARAIAEFHEIAPSRRVSIPAAVVRRKDRGPFRGHRPVVESTGRSTRGEQHAIHDDDQDYGPCGGLDFTRTGMAICIS